MVKALFEGGTLKVIPDPVPDAKPETTATVPIGAGAGGSEPAKVGLSAYNAKDAIALVGKTFDEKLLDHWIVEESRSTVLDAITFALFPVQAHEAARSFAAHQVFADLCHDLVGPDARLYHDQAVYKKPEKPRRFPWHQDNGYTFVTPQQYLTCWVALTDATLDNGCPVRDPSRGHAAAPLRQPQVRSETTPMPCGPGRQGGIVAVAALTGPNTTDAVRKAYILQYAPDGAEVWRGDPASGSATGRELANDPHRQFPVLVGGRPASVEPLR
jgi:hypothetical protein